MKIGIIGGSGLYEIDGVTDLQEHAIDTPFGAPSDIIMGGRLGDNEVFFLPRHGRGHRLLPGELNHRANIFAFKFIGIERILSFSAVGSFKEDLAPGDFVLIDQFVDRTRHTPKHTFFGDGVAGHIAFSHPTCDVLRRTLNDVCRGYLSQQDTTANVHSGGTYLNMEGPAFSTLAESMLYKSWGMDVIGMTNMAEARLAREAEICYLTVAMVTDYDCWREGHESVSVEMVIKTLMQNAANAREIIKLAVPAVAAEARDCPCSSALACAVITSPDAIAPETVERLRPIVGKYLT